MFGGLYHTIQPLTANISNLREPGNCGEKNGRLARQAINEKIGKDVVIRGSGLGTTMLKFAVLGALAGLAASGGADMGLMAGLGAAGGAIADSEG